MSAITVPERFNKASSAAALSGESSDGRIGVEERETGVGDPEVDYG